jgi:hypothetical protein
MVLHLSTLLSSLSRFFIPSQSLLIWSLVRRVNLTTRFKRVLHPISNNSVQEIYLAHLSLCSPYQIMNLTFNAITVSAKHPTDVTRFVVVV